MGAYGGTVIKRAYHSNRARNKGGSLITVYVFGSRVGLYRYIARS
ncbi:hypothetical protein ACFTAO_19525 [Paenibacillus rhizoplanae]